jgi:RHS repeat-associated protein
MQYDDALLRPTKIIPPGGKAQVVTEYHDTPTDVENHTISVKTKTQVDSSHWVETTKRFDAAMRPTQTTQQDAAGNIVVDMQYDSLGRVWKTSNPYRTGGTPVWTTTGYDELGRVITVTTPDSAVVTTAFRLHTNGTDGIPFGTMTLVTDQANIKRLVLTDAGGNLTDVWEIKSSDSDTVSVTFDGTTALAGYRTSYRYDIAGRLHEVQQGSQHRYFAYDPLGRLVRAKNVEQETNSSLPSLTDPISDNSAWAQGYTYDPNGNLLVTTTARNSTITNTYDALNRVTLRDYSGSMGDVVYRYDTVTHGLGKPASVSNGLVTTRYTEYSAMGELLQSEQEFDGVAAPYMFHCAYNMAGQMVTETYPSGRVVMDTFDSEGKVDSVSSRGAGHAPHIFANGFHYNDKGVMDRLRLGNGLWEGGTINNRYQPTQITLGTSSGGSELLKLDYNYGSNDNNGNVLSQTITVPTIGTATGFVTTQAYTYDSLNRLATVAETQYGQTTADWGQQFGFDRHGNRSMGTGSAQTFGRNSTETQSLIGPDPTVSTSTNRITNKTGEHYEFDASGNMTKDALGNRSVYDIENHQTDYYYSTNSGSTPDAKYYYDGDGKRIKKVVGTETTVFVYDAAGKLTAEYTLGISANPSPQSNYITTDTLGSARLVTNGTGEVVARHDYLPFGDEIYGLGGRTSAQGFAQPDTTRKRFTGYEHDSETGLDFAQARYYGNGLGRFTSVDPIMESAKSATPQTWNRFVYVVNNPLKFVDPTGLSGTPWDLLTKKEQKLIATRLDIDQNLRGRARRSAAKAAFNKMAQDAVDYSADHLATNDAERLNIRSLGGVAFAYGIKSLIHNSGGDVNSAVWQQISGLQGGWIGGHLDANFSLRIGDETKFLNALSASGRYDVDKPYEGWAGGDHSHSARFITWDSHGVGMHLVKDQGQPNGTWFVHWDRRSSAFVNVDPKYNDVVIGPCPVCVVTVTAREQEQISAGREHSNGIFAMEAYFSLAYRQRVFSETK